MATLYASSLPPVKGSAYTFITALYSQADTKLFQTSVTLAAGDVTVFGDGSALGNIAVLPTEIGATGNLMVTVSAANMNYNQVAVRFSDAAGAQWCDSLIVITTVAAVTVSALTQADILSDATPFAGANIDDAITSRSTFDNTTDNVIVGSLVAAAMIQFFTTNTGLDWGDSVDGSIVREILDGVPPSSVGAAAIWAYVTRTLTQSAAQLADAVSGSTITIQRGDTLSASITNIGALTDYVSVDLTVKRKKTDADSAAVLRVRVNLSGTDDGLLRINGAAPTDATDGSITIDDLASGDITLRVEANITAELTPQNQQMYYDIQMITATDVQTMAEGLCNISADVTQAIV